MSQSGGMKPKGNKSDFHRVHRRLEQAKQKGKMRWVHNVANNPVRTLQKYYLNSNERRQLGQKARNILEGTPPATPPPNGLLTEV